MTSALQSSVRSAVEIEVVVRGLARVEPHETVYGEYQYAAEDLDGHHWLFFRHATDHRR
jgi:hypothetical protein